MKIKSIKTRAICLMMVISLLCACSPVEVKPDKTPAAAPKPTQTVVPTTTPTTTPVPTSNSAELSKIKPNENGQVMILMYHNLGTKEEEWTRTYDNFRKDMNHLYDKGYRLISLQNFLQNKINVPAGKSPFLLTFDDAPQSQFNLIESGGKRTLDPNCAVGILEEMKRKHADFGKGGTFYVYYPVPFRQKEFIKEKFEFLQKNDYEIGNHSYTHDSLKNLSAEQIQKTLALNVYNARLYLPGYEVASLALPYGEAPKGESFKYVISGEYQDTRYYNKAVLKVGWNPTVPPAHIKYDAARLPRIRGSEMKVEGVGMYDWLKYFDKNPGKRYVSDGDPDTIAVPQAEVKNINKAGLNGKKLIAY